MDKNQIIEALRTIKRNLKEKYGIDEIFIFGSYVKGTATPSSDIDIAVKVNDKSFLTWTNYLSAKDDFNNLLKKDIDVVYIDPVSVNPIILDEIEKDSIKIE